MLTCLRAYKLSLSDSHAYLLTDFQTHMLTCSRTPGLTYFRTCMLTCFQTFRLTCSHAYALTDSRSGLRRCSIGHVPKVRARLPFGRCIPPSRLTASCHLEVHPGPPPMYHLPEDRDLHTPNPFSVRKRRQTEEPSGGVGGLLGTRGAGAGTTSGVGGPPPASSSGTGGRRGGCAGDGSGATAPFVGASPAMPGSD